MRFLLVGVLPCLVTLAGLASPTPEQFEGSLRYDSATVVNVSGLLADVREVPPNNPLVGLHLLLSAHAEMFDVYLGPAEYLKEFEVAFSKGTVVQIIGSRVNLGGAPVVLAREVRLGKTTLYLRDPTGAPNWPPSKEAPAEGTSRSQ